MKEMKVLNAVKVQQLRSASDFSPIISPIAARKPNLWVTRLSPMSGIFSGEFELRNNQESFQDQQAMSKSDWCYKSVGEHILISTAPPILWRF